MRYWRNQNLPDPILLPACGLGLGSVTIHNELTTPTLQSMIPTRTLFRLNTFPIRRGQSTQPKGMLACRHVRSN
jgi:hypothetical protein